MKGISKNNNGIPGLPGADLSPWAAAALVILAAIIPYLNIFQNEFVNYDDNRFILENEAIRSLTPGNIAKIMNSYTPGAEAVEACPLTRVTWAVNYHFHGFETWGYHLGNLLLHAAACVLLLFLLRAGPWGAGVALWAALLFAVHPVHTESVTWMVARKDPLSASLGFASMILYLKMCRGEGSLKKVLLWLLSMITFIAAFYAKPTAVVFPALLALWIVCLDPRDSIKRNLIPLIPMFAAGALLVLAQASIANEYGIVKTYLGGSFCSAQFTNGNILLRYLGLLFVPIRLCVQHAVHAPEGWTEPVYLLGWIGVTAVGAGYLFWARGNRNKWFYAGWFILAIAPVMQIVPTAVYMADRYLYVPSVAFCLAVAVIAKRTSARIKTPAAVAVVACIILFLFAGLTFSRNYVWRNSETLWNDTLAKNPKSIHAATNLGLYYLGQGDSKGAEKLFLQAAKIGQNHFIPFVNLGTIYAERGDFPTSAQYLEIAHRINPDYPGIKKSLAFSYFQVGRYADAATLLQEYLKDIPDNVEGHELLCHSLIKAERFADAIGPCKEFLEFQPEDARTLSMYAGALYKTEQYEKAIPVYKKFNSIYNGNTAPGWVNLGLCYLRLNDNEQAADAWRQALEIDPTNENARKYLEAIKVN